MVTYFNPLDPQNAQSDATNEELQDEEDAEYVSEYYRLMMEGKVFCLSGDSWGGIRGTRFTRYIHPVEYDVMGIVLKCWGQQSEGGLRWNIIGRFLHMGLPHF